MRHFGLLLENGKLILMDLETGEILVYNNRYLIQMYLKAYENKYTLTLIQGLTFKEAHVIIRPQKER